MRSVQSELVACGVVADLSKFEENYMENNSELNPIQRRLVLRRLKRQNDDADRQKLHRGN